MSIKEEAWDIALVCFLAIVLILGIEAYNFFESKFSKHINPEAIVAVQNIETEALNNDLNVDIDEELKSITTSVVNISRQEEHLTFEQVYKRIKKLEYYDLPPLYWEQLDESQKIESLYGEMVLNSTTSQIEEWEEKLYGPKILLYLLNVYIKRVIQHQYKWQKILKEI